MKKKDLDLKNLNETPELRTVAALERIAQAFRVLLWQESKTHGLSPIQIQILHFINYHPEERCHVSYLAEEFSLTKATVSDSVKSLEQKKLVKKINSPLDNRSIMLRLTSKGKEIAALTSEFSRELSIAISRLSPDNLNPMLNGLLEIIDGLNRNGIITVKRMCMNCRYYEKRKDGTGHFCHLMYRELKPEERRTDCPEHEPVG